MEDENDDLYADFEGMSVRDTRRRVGYTRIGPTDGEPEVYDYIISDLMFTDQAGSKSTEPRPQLKECLRSLKADDLFLIPSMDRLARNTKELVSLVQQITDMNITIRFMDTCFELGHASPAFDEKFEMLKATYEFEQTLALERRKEGLIKAKKKGVRLGRPTKLTEEKRQQILKRFIDGEKAPALAKKYGVSESLVYQIAREG